MKYTLRFRRKGEELEPQTKVVRRHRRSEERELAPEARRLLSRKARRDARKEARVQLERERQEFNSAGADEPEAEPPAESETNEVNAT